MSPRVVYWTSAFEPEMEAIASEVATLRQHFPSSIAWGLSHRHWLLLSRRRGYCLNPRLHLIFRAATRIVEPFFDINHIFGSIGDWFYLQGVRKHPTILTMAAYSQPVHNSLLEGVDRFVVEYPGGKEYLTRIGIEQRRICLILPPVDLKRFFPSPPPGGPFTVLFASSPDDEKWLSARGVPAILDAAYLRPEMKFRLLWRPWGNSERQVRKWIAKRDLDNVELLVGCRNDMPDQYSQAHVTIAPFTSREQSKPAPNSIVESLASGRPVLVTELVGLSDLILDGKAGEVCDATGEELAEYLEQIERRWDDYSKGARKVAEQWFGVKMFLEKYQQLYDEVLGA